MSGEAHFVQAAGVFNKPLSQNSLGSQETELTLPMAMANTYDVQI